MSFSPYLCKSKLRELAAGAGFCGFGIACADVVDPVFASVRRRWIESGMNAGMDYLARYDDVRSDVRLMVEGARSVIVLAMSYYDPSALPGVSVARYALGDDYHDVLRRLCVPIAGVLESEGFAARICVDTAPVAERYWAVKAGVGVIGLNSTLIVKDAGSFCFLCEIVTDAPLPPDSPAQGDCGRCGRCVKACPAGALNGDNTLDARRCLSYLTIEHRGNFPPGTDLHGCLYGCGRCQEVCPHNVSPAVTPRSEFMMRPDYAALSLDQVIELDQNGFSTIFARSAIKRAKLAGLVRNALTLKDVGK